MRVRGVRDVGAAVRDARRRQHLSQQDVAERAGVQRYQVANLELGKSNPSLRAVLATCSAVGLELDVRPKGQTLEHSGRQLAEPVSLADVLASARS
jgi:transcriptional regulator with XRE-family HTH domain